MIPTAEGNAAAGRATVVRLRPALAGVPGGAEVGGNTAQNADFNQAVYGNFPLMLAVIALVTFVLLARTFRSVALAVKAVVLNVISLGAAYGFLVLFWQSGHGSKLIYNIPATGSIRNFVPILVFAFLFGLSMVIQVRVIATGLAAGIVVDAVVVRTLLVPALVAIMGRWNWWLPGPLARLLRVPAAGLAGP